MVPPCLRSEKHAFHTSLAPDTAPATAKLCRCDELGYKDQAFHDVSGASAPCDVEHIQFVGFLRLTGMKRRHKLAGTHQFTHSAENAIQHDLSVRKRTTQTVDRLAPALRDALYRRVPEAATTRGKRRPARAKMFAPTRACAQPDVAVDASGGDCGKSGSQFKAQLHPRRGKPGLGFPLVWLVCLCSLATKVVLRAGAGARRGKGKSKRGLLRELWRLLEPGDVLARDSHCCRHRRKRFSP